MAEGAAGLDRRTLLSCCALAAGLAATTSLAGCGGSGSSGSSTLVEADIARRPVEPTAAAAAVRAVAGFSRDLLAALATDANLVCSPFSVLAVLAMVRNGATGETAREFDRALHLPDLPALNAGLNAVAQALASRSGQRRGADDGKAKVELAVAQQVWGDVRDVWQPAFLETLAADYGIGVRTSDIAGHPEQARHAVNGWVAKATAGRIKDLLPPGSVHALTRLILANALYVKAPWHDKLHPAGPMTFHAPNGPVATEMLSVNLHTGGRTGPGWTAACLPLAGQELGLTVVLPKGTLTQLLQQLTGAALLDLLRPAEKSVAVTMPAFTVRSRFSLPKELQRLGIKRAFGDGAEFDRLTTTERLHLAVVEHQGWIAVDEHGLAATAVTARTSSALAPPRLTLVLDRPFLIVVHDVALRLPLLVGVITDPSATGH